MMATAEETPAAPGAWVPLVERGRWLGHQAWLEARVFEVLGRWVQDVPEPEVKLSLAAHSRHHAWHAELLQGHLPAVADIEPAALVVPPNDGLVSALDAVAKPARPDATVDKLAGFYRVLLPYLVTSYRRALDAASVVADASLARSLRFVVADDVAEWQEGEALLRGLLRTTDDVDAATAHQARVERLIVSSSS